MHAQIWKEPGAGLFYRAAVRAGGGAVQTIADGWKKGRFAAQAIRENFPGVRVEFIRGAARVAECESEWWACMREDVKARERGE